MPANSGRLLTIDRERERNGGEATAHTADEEVGADGQVKVDGAVDGNGAVGADGEVGVDGDEKVGPEKVDGEEDEHADTDEHGEHSDWRIGGPKRIPTGSAINIRRHSKT